MRASSIVSTMQTWLKNQTSKKTIIDIYNTQSSKPRGYKVQYTDNWCATCVTAAFIQNGETPVFAECSCGQMVSKAKNAGIWVENEDRMPNVGDIILYDWGDNGTGDNTGWPDHVGVVTEVNSSTGNFVVIEGNKGDKMGSRTLQRNAKYIRGFITPNYVKETSVTSTTVTTGDSSKVYTVTASALNVRAGAGTSYKVLNCVYKGNKVTVTKTDGNWGYIGTGWVCMTYLAASGVADTRTVTANSLCVRAGAGTNYKVTGYLKKGATVTVQKTSGIWAYIGTGWCSTKYLA